MEAHEAADLFPLDEEGIPELAEDIKRRGLVVPIVLFGGKILDGRRRFRACQIAGVEPRFEESGTDDPIALSWSLNGPRRHLNTSQKAMAGARMREMYDRQAKERMSRGGEEGGRGRPKQGKENLPDPMPHAGQARDHAGRKVGVSGRSIDHATKVLTKAVPEVVAAVDAGRMAVSTAAAVADEDEEAQRAAAAQAGKRRVYGGGPNGTVPKGDSRQEQADAAVKVEPQQAEPESDAAKSQRPGVGIIKANEAINCLSRIPKNDPHRRRGLQIVTDWIRSHK